MQNLQENDLLVVSSIWNTIKYDYYDLITSMQYLLYNDINNAILQLICATQRQNEKNISQFKLTFKQQ